MGSSIDAFVAAAPDLLVPIAAQLRSRCISLPQDYVLVPIPDDAMPENWEDAYEEFSNLPPEIADAVQRASHAGPIAYLEAETFAGEGVQRAVVWNRGEIAWGPRHTCDVEADAGGELVWEPNPLDTAVNAALREIGVARGDEVDEYAALGLHLRRSTRDWLAEA